MGHQSIDRPGGEGDEVRLVIDDPVNHPSHYTYGTIEVIDVIDGLDLDFYQAQIVKYVARWKRKGGVQDLQKAQWYLNRYIERNS